MTPAELAERRRALGLTQTALAAKLGVARVTLHRWEHGTQPISPYLALALSALEAEEKPDDGIHHDDPRR